MSAVYTALLTNSPQQEAQPVSQIEDEASSESENRASALAMLNSHPRLVLLGRPGTGKSSFVRFVARCLCAEILHPNSRWLESLKAPLQTNSKKELNPQPWQQGKLLPVIITLREFATSAQFPANGEKGTAKHLADFITAKLRSYNCEAFAPHLLDEMRDLAGRCLLMLDGLDEVPDADRKRQQLKDVIQECVKAFPGCCRILVTSRPYAYSTWALEGFDQATLAPFTDIQIDVFIERWYRHIAPKRKLSPAVEVERATHLQQVIRDNERLREFARNPLLLTLMASLHAARGGDLPEKRAELYKDAVDLLLKNWEADKGLKDLLGIKLDDLRIALCKLAYEVHVSQPVGLHTADIPLEKLIIALNIDRKVHPQDLADYLNGRAGLLVSEDGQVYQFPHRTFQEYMAACYLALSEGNFPYEIAKLARHDPDRWREVTLLTGGQVSLGGTTYALWGLIEKLCFRAPEDPNATKADVWGAQLAGLALSELIDPIKLNPADQVKLAQVQQWLVHILQVKALPVTECVLAGNALGRLGDPRFSEDYWFLRADQMLGFVKVEEGPFIMGSDRYPDEMPRHSVALPEYYINRFPVTVAQWRCFIAENRHIKWKDRADYVANHPVVNVTWYEAKMYCEWLTRKLRTEAIPPRLGELLLKDSRWHVTLPSEAEWEKAARGTDGKPYPWGEKFDKDQTNTGDANIGTTTAAGCFPGTNQNEVMDLSGNVWEWTRSLWGTNWKEPDFLYPYRTSDGREDLDAAENILRVRKGGSFKSDSRSAHSATRGKRNPRFRIGDGGFRVVLSLDTKM